MASADIRSNIQATLRESSRVMSALADQTADIEKAAEILIMAYRQGKKMVLFGNGGSAADAQHLATELVNGFTIHDRPSLPALALTTDTSALTAIGNDFDFESVFSRQVESMANAGDVVIGISTSGNSKNVIRGLEMARKRGAVVMGLTGESGGKMKDLCDVCIRVPSKDTPRIQESHIAVGHILCALIERAMA